MFGFFIKRIWLIIAILLFNSSFANAEGDNTGGSATDLVTGGSSGAEIISLSELLADLTHRKYKIKTAAIENIIAAEFDSKNQLLTSLLNAEVYYRKSDKKIFYLKKVENGYSIQSLTDSESKILPKKRGFKKISINNKLRIKLRSAIAALELGNTDRAVRLAAVKQIMKKLTSHDVVTLKKYAQSETDSEIKTLMELALSIDNLKSDDDKIVLVAIEKLRDSLEPTVANSLRTLLERTDSKQIKLATQAALKNIDTKVDLYGKIETVYFGISLGSVLVLAGIGLAITFGVMGVINMAHGELIMIGAYTTYVIQQLMPNSIGMSIIVAIPAAFIVAGLVGILMERTVIRHLYGRPLETLLATFGISLILQQAVRSIFSPLNRVVVTPEWMSGALEINSVLSLTWNRLYIIVFCIMVFFAIMAAMKKTSLGLQVRAVSQNRQMARAMGVKSDWVDAITFGIGAGIAGIAGVALSLLTNVGPNLGQAYIIDSFMVVVFGGVGNLWGTLVAGMSLGIFNKMLEPWAGAVLAKILILVFIILFIQKRPRGLFPQRGRAAEG